MRDRLGYVPALDGLRGVAIASVVTYHAFPARVRSGFIGVDLFFILSGFLITNLLLEEHARHGGISLRRFYGRRARRLMPVAIAGIAFFEVIALGVTSAGGHIGGQALGGVFALFYVENLAHFLHPPVVSGVGHYWSLSQEEQFYLVWPPVLIVLLRGRVRMRVIVGVLAAVAVAVAVHRGFLSDGRRLYGPDARSDGMVAGCMLAIVWRSGRLRAHARWLRIAGPAASAFFLAFLFAAPSHAMTYVVTGANVAALLVLASLLVLRNGRLPKLLSLPPLRWLGLISYSLYIWQPFVVSVLGLHGMLMLGVAIIVAVLSYRFIERPFRQRRTATSDAASLPASTQASLAAS